MVCPFKERRVSAIHFSNRNLGVFRDICKFKTFANIIFKGRVVKESNVNDFYFVGCFFKLPLFTISWSQVNVFLSSHRQLTKSFPKVAKLHKIAKIIWNFQMWSGIPLPALQTWPAWFGPLASSNKQQAFYLVPSFPLRHRSIFACTVCASLADEFYLPPQHPEDE